MPLSRLVRAQLPEGGLQGRVETFYSSIPTRMVRGSEERLHSKKPVQFGHHLRRELCAPIRQDLTGNTHSGKYGQQGFGGRDGSDVLKGNSLGETGRKINKGKDVTVSF